MATVEVTAQNFNDTVKEGTVLLDFWASWCGPCRNFSPVFEGVSEEHPEYTFGKVNTDEQTELAQAFQVMSIPTLMIFRDGIRIFEGAGALDKHSLEDLIKQAEGLDMDEVRAKIAEMEKDAAAE
ncbi:MAG: thioredoxin [Actinomycetaceae bacterium]|nr:thioredoxin [Arcanobacterium sp.]MDD7504658.1 thioredoxin [Actinomycetaceae bacterium]MDY6143144.1 thioredoxin [Arcanobacterium sp.]